MQPMRVLSLFSGVGGLDLGLERAGMTIVGMCEIDKRARSVLARHWPSIPIHDDVTTLNGKDWHGSVDLVSGGSPCQDLSVAGRRKGLDGARSGLFWHQCRIADQSAASWVLWENVLGALSSNSGADFAAVLWGITGAYPELPNGGRWRNSGVIVGPRRWAVWRLLDAQFFGVPQRRRRLFVVAGPRTDMRPEILLESTGLPGDPQPQRAAGEEVASTLRGGTPGGGPKPDTDRMTFVKAIRSGARDAEGNLPPEASKPDTTCPTLSAFDNNSETRATVLAFEMRTRDGAPQAEITGNNVAGPLRTGTGGSSKPMIATVLAFYPHASGHLGFPTYCDISPTITVGSGVGIPSPPGVLAPTLAASNDPSQSPQSTDLTNQVEAVSRTGYGVRRLTPTECERLMGWPDDWTRWDEAGTEQADSHRYRQCGNGVVSNVAEWIGRRIMEAA